jgi:hypothetical protein
VARHEVKTKKVIVATTRNVTLLNAMMSTAGNTNATKINFEKYYIHKYILNLMLVILYFYLWTKHLYKYLLDQNRVVYCLEG